MEYRKAKRIQRKRSKGWRMPPDAVFVGRPTRWANEYVIGEQYVDQSGAVFIMTREKALANYRKNLERMPLVELINFLAPLHGKDLACWCALDQDCHADILLTFADNIRNFLSAIKKSYELEA